MNLKLVANQVARQWWETEISPTTRNHMWIENGMARYAELLYIEHVNGAGALEQERHDTFVTALTVDKPPLIQSARLEDYSPEYWAATAGKGAAVVQHAARRHGRRQLLQAAQGRAPEVRVEIHQHRRFSRRRPGYLRPEPELLLPAVDRIERRAGIQVEILRVARPQRASVVTGEPQPGFRVMGTITQDLDLFRMPVTLHIETDGNPEEKQIEVVGTSSEFSVDTFGKPRNGPDGVTLDPKDKVLEIRRRPRAWKWPSAKASSTPKSNEFPEALAEYQKALDVLRNSSLAHYRIGELFFLQSNWTSRRQRVS